MAASAVQNPSTQTDSKSAKKKKARGAERTESPAPAASTPEKAASIPPNDASLDESDSPYVRELAKNIRNLNKKLANASKTDNVIAENKGKTLEELVTLKIINADQKAQHLKKPGLQAQLSQLEEQITQIKKVDHEYRSRATAERAELEKSLTEKYEKEKADAISDIKAKAETELKKALHDGLLVLSQFLRLAAARRAEESNAELDENLALEGVLLHIYSGDETGVDTMMKLVQGSDDQTKSVSGEVLQTTHAQVKAASIAHAGQSGLQVEGLAEPSDAAVESKAEPQTDPTLAHASLTEIDEGTTTALTNGVHEDSLSSAHPTNADVGDSAANIAGESQWDASNADNMGESQEWIQVARDPAETETGLTATPAVAANTQSWADDQPDNPPETSTPTDPNDGFHQVQRNRGRGDREGGWRGRGGGGGYRGRGFRGDGRGRGRGGGGRGGQTPFRPRRTDES